MDHLTFKVKNAKKTFEKLASKGAKIAMPLWQEKTATMDYVKDPNEIWIGLITTTRKPKIKTFKQPKNKIRTSLTFSFNYTNNQTILKFI
jgi:hypothetical protein